MNTVSQPINQERRFCAKYADTTVVAALALFMLSLFPFTANFVWHHPDERHYSDAAVTMATVNDYLNVRTADGSLRFRKPLVTYWTVAASYKLFGISPLSTRLPFLLAGGTIIYLTYHLAFLIFRRRQTACLSAIIAAANPVLAVSSTRSIPDVLFCMFLLISAYGFVGILLQRQPGARYCWLAYVGAGLAVATKGLPAVAFVAYSMLFAGLNPWCRRRLSSFVHFPSALTAIVIGGAWFAYVWVSHGSGSVEAFYADQVSDRVLSPGIRTLIQFNLVVIATLLAFVPWIVPAVMSDPFGLRKVFTPRGDGPQLASRYILCWAALYAVMAALVTKFSTRYLLVTVPLLATLIADALLRLETRTLRSWLKLGIVPLATGCLVLGSAAIWSLRQLNGPPMTMAFVAGLMLIVALLSYSAFQGARLRLAMCLASMMLLAYPLSFAGIQQLAVPDQGAQLAENLSRLFPNDGEKSSIMLFGKPAISSKIRVCSQGKLHLQNQLPYDDGVATDFNAFVASRDDLSAIDESRFELHHGSQGFKDLSPAKVLSTFLQGDLQSYLDERRQVFQIVIRKDSQGPRGDRTASVAEEAWQ